MIPHGVEHFFRCSFLEAGPPHEFFSFQENGVLNGMSDAVGFLFLEGLDLVDFGFGFTGNHAGDFVCLGFLFAMAENRAF